MKKLNILYLIFYTIVIMSLIKLDKTSKYLIINVRYIDTINSIKIKNIIFNLLNYYCEFIKWNLYQVLDSKNNSIYYYITNSTYIDINRIDYILTRLLKNNNNFLITSGCYNEKEFKKYLNKYKNTNIISYYIKKNNWNWSFVCLHENNICNKNKECNNLL